MKYSANFRAPNICISLLFPSAINQEIKISFPIELRSLVNQHRLHSGFNCLQITKIYSTYQLLRCIHYVESENLFDTYTA